MTDPTFVQTTPGRCQLTRCAEGATTVVRWQGALFVTCAPHGAELAATGQIGLVPPTAIQDTPTVPPADPFDPIAQEADRYRDAFLAVRHATGSRRVLALFVPLDPNLVAFVGEEALTRAAEAAATDATSRLIAERLQQAQSTLPAPAKPVSVVGKA